MVESLQGARDFVVGFLTYQTLLGAIGGALLVIITGIGRIITQFAKDRLNDYWVARKRRRKFRELLQQMPDLMQYFSIALSRNPLARQFTPLANATDNPMKQQIGAYPLPHDKILRLSEKLFVLTNQQQITIQSRWSHGCRYCLSEELVTLIAANRKHIPSNIDLAGLGPLNQHYYPNANFDADTFLQ